MALEFRGTVAGAIAGITGLSSTVHDVRDTELSDKKVLGGKIPTTSGNGVCVLGDCKETRELFSRGYNKIKLELDILVYWKREATGETHEDLSYALQYVLTNLNPIKIYANVTRLRDAEPAREMHENIWRKRYVLEVKSFETTTP